MEWLEPLQLQEMEARAEISVTLVSNRSIRKLNREWMGKDFPTDVLSFPLSLESPEAGMPWEMGDLVISVEKASEQALVYGHSLERELAFLLVHGFLHVLGFDHQTEADEKEMFGRQREVLRAAGFPRTIVNSG